MHTKTWTVILTALGVFMTALDTLVVATSLPALRIDLHASLQSLEWTVNAYNLAFACLILTGAALGDRFGRRRMYVVGLVLAGAGAVGLTWGLVRGNGAGWASVEVLGVAVLASVFASHGGYATPRTFVDGFTDAIWVAVAFSALGVVAAVLGGVRRGARTAQAMMPAIAGEAA